MGISGSDVSSLGGGLGNWEQWSHIATIFSVVITGGLVPLSFYLARKIKNMREFNAKKRNENIKEIATQVSHALDDKLNQKIEQQSQAIESVSETMEKLSQKLDHTDKQNKAILTTIRRLSSDFDSFKSQQVRVNAKVDFIDDIFRNHVTFDGNNNND